MKSRYFLKRIVEKSIYSIGQKIYGLNAKRYFDTKLNGAENLPEGSAVLAFNHCFGLDGIFTCVSFPRQIHHMIQFEGVYNRNAYNRLCLWGVGFIPVSVGEVDENKITKKGSIDDARNIRALKRAEDYLKSYSDFVGIFIDGPASRLLDENNKPIERERRMASGSAALVAIASKRPIVPVGLYMPEDMQEKLWEFGYDRHKQNIRFLKARKKSLEQQGETGLIKYNINIGKPIYPESLEGNNSQKRKELTRLIKDEIVKLSRL